MFSILPVGIDTFLKFYILLYMNENKSKFKAQLVYLGLCILISITGNGKNTYQSPVLKEEKDRNCKLKQSKQGKQELEGFPLFIFNDI